MLIHKHYVNILWCSPNFLTFYEFIIIYNIFLEMSIGIIDLKNEKEIAITLEEISQHRVGLIADESHHTISKLTRKLICLRNRKKSNAIHGIIRKIILCLEFKPQSQAQFYSGNIGAALKVAPIIFQFNGRSDGIREQNFGRYAQSEYRGAFK